MESDVVFWKSVQSVKNDAVGKSAHILVGVEATEFDAGSEDAQVANHRESMNSVSEQTSRDDGSANKHSQKLATSESTSSATGRQVESVSVAAVAVAGGTQQAINEEDFTDDSDGCSEEALPYQEGDWAKIFKNSVSIVNARDSVFSVVES
jgi:hypothetical protein